MAIAGFGNSLSIPNFNRQIKLDKTLNNKEEENGPWSSGACSLGFRRHSLLPMGTASDDDVPALSASGSSPEPSTL